MAPANSGRPFNRKLWKIAGRVELPAFAAKFLITVVRLNWVLDCNDAISSSNLVVASSPANLHTESRCVRRGSSTESRPSAVVSQAVSNDTHVRTRFSATSLNALRLQLLGRCDACSMSQSRACTSRLLDPSSSAKSPRAYPDRSGQCGIGGNRFHRDLLLRRGKYRAPIMYSPVREARRSNQCTLSRARVIGCKYGRRRGKRAAGLELEESR
jgi:hypothetical protein